MKMICSILLLLSLTSCVSGPFVVNVTQTSYQAEENHNITLEWMFTPRTSSSTNIHIIRCRLFADHKYFVLFHLLKGVEVPESQDKQFTGRVRWDKDVLRDGRIRLHMSRLRINDSGWYQCDMHTGDGRSSGICRLKVTAAADEPKPPRPTMRPQPERPTTRPQPERPTMRPQPESLKNLSLSFGLIALLVLCAGLSGLCFALLLKFTGKRGNLYRAVKTMSSLEKKVIKTNQVTTSSAEIRSCLEGNPQAAKTSVNSCETQCPTTYHNLNHSRSMPNLNYSRSMPNLNYSRSMHNLNHSRSMHNLNHSSSMFNSINF
ncbi:uncharacterized protein LOC141760294 isoform X1 [Sebastes fasciatus]|uniref:uncharacterized protein LOC141760294 isoform X1 n=1 Tax=Sebastes fasciatus TaxID=394691 RepID=UPI003D9E55D5